MQGPAATHRLPELDGDGVAGPKADDRVAFVQHVVTGDQQLARLQGFVAESEGFPVIRIPAVLDRQERAGIDEDQDGLP